MQAPQAEELKNAFLQLKLWYNSVSSPIFARVANIGQCLIFVVTLAIAKRPLPNVVSIFTSPLSAYMVDKDITTQLNILN